MHLAPISRIAVDMAERFLVSGSRDKTLRIWSLDNGQLIRTLRVPLGAHNVGKVYAVAISSDGERIAAGGHGPGENSPNSIYIFERTTGLIVTRVDGVPNVINCLSFSPNGRYLVACLGGSNGVRIYEADSLQEAASDGAYGATSYWAAFDRSGRLVTSSWDGKIRLYSSAFCLTHVRDAPGGGQPLGVAFSPEGAHVAVGYADSTKVDLLDGQTLAPLFGADTEGVGTGNLSRVAWSTDGRFIYAGGRWQPLKHALLRRWADDGLGAVEDIPLSRNSIVDLLSLRDGRLSFGAADPCLGVLGRDRQIVWRRDPAQADFRNQFDKLVVSHDGMRVGFGFEPAGNSPAVFDVRARRLILDTGADQTLMTARTEAPRLAIEGWKDSYTPSLNGKRLPLAQNEASLSLAIAPDGQRFLLGAHWSLRSFDRHGLQLWEKSVPETPWAVNVSGDGRLAIAAFADGTIRWFRLEDGTELLAFFPSADRQRWVVWTPPGYYMATPGGEELIGWHINRGLDTPAFYTAGRFRDRFHRPDVVALVQVELDVDKALDRANRKAELVPASTPPLDAILPPIVQILEPTFGTQVERDPVAIRWHAWAPGGESITSLRVMTNGTLAMTLAAPDPAEPIWLSVMNKARSGRATISLVAENVCGVSDATSIDLKIAASTAAPAPPAPHLFVIAVGVGIYKEKPPTDLKYAARDADDIATLFLRQQGLYGKVSAQALTNTDATCATVTTAMLSLVDQINTGDVVMIFFSGHGVVERNTYYFLPHDANPKTPAHLRLTAIEEHHLVECFKSVFDRHAKVYVFFDTCHAGALGEGGKAVSTDMERFTSKLASEENGVVVFTSCTALERSHERDEWQNGAFTEALLEALNGKAARRGERDILISDVAHYVRERVPELTAGAQRPQIYYPFQGFFDPPIATVSE
jgi:WD40 repeat protein